MCLMCGHLGLIVLDHGCQHVDVTDRHLNRPERNDITQGLPESDPLAFFFNVCLRLVACPLGHATAMARSYIGG